MCVRVLPVCVYVPHICAWCHGAQKRVLDPLKMDFWIVWGLDIELGVL